VVGVVVGWGLLWGGGGRGCKGGLLVGRGGGVARWLVGGGVGGVVFQRNSRRTNLGDLGYSLTLTNGGGTSNGGESRKSDKDPSPLNER